MFDIVRQSIHRNARVSRRRRRISRRWWRRRRVARVSTCRMASTRFTTCVQKTIKSLWASRATAWWWTGKVRARTRSTARPATCRYAACRSRALTALAVLRRRNKRRFAATTSCGRARLPPAGSFTTCVRSTMAALAVCT